MRARHPIILDEAPAAAPAPAGLSAPPARAATGRTVDDGPPAPPSASPATRGGLRLRGPDGEADLEAMADLLVMAHREGVFGRLPIDRARMPARGRAMLQRPDRYLLLMAERVDAAGGPTDLEGILVATVERLMFSPAKLGSVSGLYVVPSARGNWAAVRLLKTFRAWADDRGAAACAFQVTSGVRYNRTHKLMTRLGWRLVGGNYVG